MLALQFITFVLNTSIGVFILAKNPRSNVNRAFALFALATGGWNLSIFLTLSEIGPGLLWGRLAFSFGAVMAAGLLRFVHIFPEKTKRWKFWSVFSWILAAVFFILAASPLMIKTVEIAGDGINYITGEFNPLPYLIWTIYFLGTLAYIIFISWVKSVRSRGLVRRQMLSVTIAVTLHFVLSLITNLLLPIFAGDFRWNNLGPIFTIFIIVLIGHAIIRYRFLEIRWVIKKSFDFVILWGFAFLILSAFCIGLSRFFTSTTVNISAAFAFAIFFMPVAQYINKITARVTAHGSYIYEDAVDEITELVHTSVGLAALQKVAAKALRKYFGFSKIAIISFSANQPDKQVKSLVDKFKKNVLSDIPKAMQLCQEKNMGIIEISELKWRLDNNIDPTCADRDKELFKFMEERGAAVMIPFFVGEEMVGLMITGEKPDSKLLSRMDIDVLRVMQGTVAPAMANGIRIAEIERLYEQLSELDKAKSDFIGVVSHQFRTPLTAILWNAELALDSGKVLGNEAKNLSEIQQRANFLNLTLNRIFEMLALEAKKLSFHPQKIDLYLLVEETIRAFQHTARTKGLEFIINLEHMAVKADVEKMISVLNTLIENACNFSRAKGKIEVTLQADEKNKMAVLTVKDNGIGISKKDKPRIFEKFYRASNAQKHFPDGAGISLYLAKQLMQKQGGIIDFSSEEDNGTTFRIRMPLNIK
ncbi:MAG: ATP-binding protein [Patescibacteria group bacterium]